MREPEFEQALEEAIRKAVETALKAYEAATHNDVGNAAPRESANSLPSTLGRRERDEVESFRRSLAGAGDEDAHGEDRGKKRPVETARGRARASHSFHRHGGDALPPLTSGTQDGGSYHTAILQHATQPDKLFDSLIPYCSREQTTSAATRVIPARQDRDMEGRGSLQTAIEQLRQDMNRNHGEAANAATRKNHSRP